MVFGLIGGVIGAILLIVGAYLVFFFPMTVDHQSEKFGHLGMVLGIIFLIAGGILVFLP